MPTTKKENALVYLQKHSLS